LRGGTRHAQAGCERPLQAVDHSAPLESDFPTLDVHRGVLVRVMKFYLVEWAVEVGVQLIFESRARRPVSRFLCLTSG
jgi:hypothetical protein